MSLQVQNIKYVHANNETLFQNISFSLSEGDKCAIVGNNGVGKSTLLGIISGNISATSGQVSCNESPYSIPQHFGQFNQLTVAQALGVERKLNALDAVFQGRGSESDLLEIDNDWELDDNLRAAFTHWKIPYIDFNCPMGQLSGGEKTKVFLAGLDIFQSEIVVMDEPTNHLDMESRELLYEYIRNSDRTMLIVSHDRTLLNIMPSIYELRANGIRFFPMSYDAYKDTIDKENEAIEQLFQHRQKEMKKAQKLARETIERQQKHSMRGEKQNAKKGIPRIAMGNLRDKSENSTAKLNKLHQEKIEVLNSEVQNTRMRLSKSAMMKVDIDNASLVNNKLLAEAVDLTFRYSDDRALWEDSPLNFSIYSGEHIWLQGANGSGKSTLLKLITGQLEPTGGTLSRPTALSVLYLDQEYSIIKDNLSVYEQVERYSTAKPEHEIKMLLNRFLFPSSTWDKKCSFLSGGERMRLALCCLQVCETAPDMIIADEPTNNIDISNMEILADTFNSYQGTLIVVSHDVQFIHDLSLERILNIDDRDT